MKILIITDWGFENGGVSTYIKSIRNVLEKRGHIVRVLSSDVYFESKRISDYEFGGVKEKGTIRWYLNRLFNIKSLVKTAQILKILKPDVVHLNYIDHQVSPSILFCLRNVAVIMTIHDYSLICPSVTNIHISNTNKKQSIKGYFFEKIKKHVYFKLINNIDIFISPSKSLELFFRKNYITKIQTIKHGIKILKYAKSINNLNLLYVGRLSEEKGVNYLLEAMPFIINNIPNIHLDIIGEGPEKNKLEEIMKTLKTERYITFIGQVPNKNIEKYYKRTNLVIIPSICKESFSLVGIEAMSVGRPVIGTNIGAIPEWLDDGKTGFLVDPGNSEQIAEKVIQLLSDRELLEQMSKNARKQAEKFSIEKHVEKLEETYLEVVNKYKL